MASFARRHGAGYRYNDRQLSAAFEIGCFLSLAHDYEVQASNVTVQNLVEDQFRYLTTPNGNPHNFSYLKVQVGGASFELRQQVRIRSHIDPDICFTPDIVVLRGEFSLGDGKDADYAAGKRRFFVVESKDVVAAHECKSMTGFPELYVSFIGMVTTAHAWFETFDLRAVGHSGSGHLAPTLFVGGEASNLHRRMIAALEKNFPINVVPGIYRGARVLSKRRIGLRRIAFPQTTSASPTAVAALVDEDIPY